MNQRFKTLRKNTVQKCMKANMPDTEVHGHTSTNKWQSKYNSNTMASISQILEISEMITFFFFFVSYSTTDRLRKISRILLFASFTKRKF